MIVDKAYQESGFKSDKALTYIFDHPLKLPRECFITEPEENTLNVKRPAPDNAENIQPHKKIKSEAIHAAGP